MSEARDVLRRTLRRGPNHLWIYGHRGARGVIAENTLLSVDHALAVGLGALEIDVLSLGDGTPVVTHNPRLLPDLTRDETGEWVAPPGPRLMDLEAADLARFEVGAARPGSAYASLFPDQALIDGLHVPTLDALAARLAARPGGAPWLMLEIKSDPNHPDDVPPLERYVAAALAAVKRHGLEATTMVQSFDWRVLARAALEAPEIARSHLTLASREGIDGTFHPGSPWIDGADAAAGAPAAIAAREGDVWAPFHADIDAAAVERAHDLGLVVAPWTVNERADMARMIAVGVDGFVTDHPGRAQRVLAEHGLGWTNRAARPN